MTLQFDKDLGVNATAGLNLAKELNAKVAAIQSNGGGVNLLRNSRGKFQPNMSVLDNNVVFATATIHMTQGQQYTVHANASDRLVWSGVHDQTKESDNVVLWLTNEGDVYQIISDANTGTKTTFTWQHPDGTYKLRVNTYKSDNSGYVEKVMIEKGIVAHDWSPNPDNVKLYKPYVTDSGDLRAKLINADGTDASES